MSLSNLLQYLLKEGMDEVAKSINDAQAANFALYKEKGIVILFEPQAFISEMENIFGDNALENNIAQLKSNMESLKPTFTSSELLKMWVDNLNILIQKTSSFNKSPNKWEAKEISEILGIINNIHYKLFITRAKKLQGKTEERLILNREKKAFERLINKLVDGVYLASDPTYGERNNADIIKNALINCIRGYVNFKLSDTCNGPTSPKTYEVSYSAAKKGWGPLTYDIVMSIVNPAYLIADRHANSSDADKIWTYYLNNRPDIHKELMEELITDEECGLPTSSNDALNDKLNYMQKLLDQKKEEHLEHIPDLTDQDRIADVMEEMKKILSDVPQAWRYQIQNPINIAPLEANFKTFTRKIKTTYGKVLGSIEFTNAARTFFDVNYAPGD